MSEQAADLKSLQERIGYTFKNPAILQRSMTHPSYFHNVTSPNPEHNQRMEFLGDAILGLIIAEELYEKLPEQREGALTRFRSVLVKGHQLAQLARENELGNYILMAEAEALNGGRERQSILEDAFEALVGALYLDGGYEVAKTVILNLYGNLNERLAPLMRLHNPKGRLQEILQPELGNEVIEYKIIDETGPDHEKKFVVEVSVQGTGRGTGIGSSKKEAEEQAARDALKWLDEKNGEPTEE